MLTVDGGSAHTTLAAYARHRGVSREAVSRAVKKGRLTESVAIVDGKPVIVDAELADREWAATTDLSKAPGYVKERARGPELELPPQSGGDMREYSLANEAAREKFWKANLAELEYRTKSGELVEASEVEAKFSEVVTVAKTKLLGLAARVRQRMPHIAPADVQTIDDLVREALECLAEDDDDGD